MPMIRRCPLIALLLGTVLVSACSIHRLDIQQGVVMQAEAIGQIEPGMTKKQVVFLLGEPPIQDPFHRQRWDYIDTFESAAVFTKRQHLVLEFDGDRLSRIEHRTVSR